MVARGWERPKPAKATQEKTVENASATRQKRNFFYQDLLRLPENAHQFIWKHFWLVKDLRIAQKDPQAMKQNEKEWHEKPFIPWSFIALFLQEVLSMEKKRIEEIKQLGDVLAAYVKEFDDQRFLNEVYSLQRGDYFRNTLLRAAKRAAAQRHPPLFRFDMFCTVFLSSDGEEVRFDWKLARDLLCIRMLEWLYDHDEKAGERVNALPEERDTDNLLPAYTD